MFFRTIRWWCACAWRLRSAWYCNNGFGCSRTVRRWRIICAVAQRKVRVVVVRMFVCGILTKRIRGMWRFVHAQKSKTDSHTEMIWKENTLSIYTALRPTARSFFTHSSQLFCRGRGRTFFWNSFFWTQVKILVYLPFCNKNVAPAFHRAVCC